MQPDFAPQIAPRVTGHDRLFDGIPGDDGGRRGRRAADVRCSARSRIAGFHTSGTTRPRWAFSSRPATRPRPPEDPELESGVGDTLSYVTETRGATRHDDGLDTTG